MSNSMFRFAFGFFLQDYLLSFPYLRDIAVHCRNGLLSSFHPTTQ